MIVRGLGFRVWVFYILKGLLQGLGFSRVCDGFLKLKLHKGFSTALLGGVLPQRAPGSALVRWFCNMIGDVMYVCDVREQFASVCSMLLSCILCSAILACCIWDSSNLETAASQESRGEALRFAISKLRLAGLWALGCTVLVVKFVDVPL